MWRAWIVGWVGWLICGVASAEPPQRRIAVLELRQAAGLSDEARAYLTDVIRGAALKLSHDRWFVLTRENILQALPPETDLSACEGDCEVETGRNVGAHVVISGELVRFGGQIRVHLKAHETDRGALISSARASAPSVGQMEAPLEAAALALLQDMPGAGAVGEAGSPMERRLAELERLQAARRAAEAAEAALKAEATQAHHAEVEARWRQVAPLGRAGGPEGRQAVQMFLDAYAEHPLGNPRAMAARALLARMADGRGVEEQGKAGVIWLTLPGGRFTLGDEAGLLDERPAHEVTLAPFQISKAEITVGQYQACVNDGACAIPGAAPRDPHPLPQGCAFERPDRQDAPMDCVTRGEAEAFARWVGGRLPSEAEWVYAATGAGQGAPADPGPAAELRPACSGPRTAQGVCDLTGNAWEWVADTYSPSYAGAPTDGAPRQPPAPPEGEGAALFRLSYTAMPRLGRPRYVLQPALIAPTRRDFPSKIRGLFEAMAVDKRRTYRRTRIGFKADAEKTGDVYVYLDPKVSALHPILMAEIFHSFVAAGARRVWFPGVESGPWLRDEARLPYPIYVPAWTPILSRWWRGAPAGWRDNLLGVSKGAAFDTHEPLHRRPGYRNAEGPRDRIRGLGFRVSR